MKIVCGDFANNISAKPFPSEVTESSAPLAMALPFPVIAPHLGGRNLGGGVQPAAPAFGEVVLDRAHAVRRSGVNRREIETHRAQQLDMQLGAGGVAKVDLLGIRRDTPDDEFFLSLEEGIGRTVFPVREHKEI